MGYCRQTALPQQEPVTLDSIRQFLRLPPAFTADDTFLVGAISAAREAGEILTGRALAKRTFTMVLDSHPYYTDTISSQLAYPPSYYSLPRYASTLWNYSQMIKLAYPPVISVQAMKYIGSDGAQHTMVQDVDFVLDRIGEPGRIFPLPGQFWPANLYVANSLQIDFTAGYDSDPTAVDTHLIASPPLTTPNQQPSSTIVTGVPNMIIMAILNLVTFWWNNRGQAGNVPQDIERIFLSQALWDFAPTRG